MLRSLIRTLDVLILTTTCLEYFVRLAIFNIEHPFQDGTFEIELFIVKVLVGLLMDEVIFSVKLQAAGR